MEGVLTEMTDPSILFKTVTSRKSYLANKPAEKNIVVKESKETKTLDDKYAKSAVYITSTDKQREDFIDRMIGKTREMLYEKPKNYSGSKSTFTEKHEDYIKNLIDDDSQFFADDIIEKLTKQIQDFSISKAQLVVI